MSNDSVIKSLSSVGKVPQAVRKEAKQFQMLENDSNGKTVSFVMLDCSGTTMDRYVDAPAIVFVEVFKDFGVDITMQEARVPMGLRKDLHIKQLTEMPSIREKWKTVHNKYPDQKDADAMFKIFVPKQLDILRNGSYSTLLPGVSEVTKDFQKDGIKLGVTTGFMRSMLDILLEGAAPQGFVPDTSVAGDEAEAPRPMPFMVLKNLERMGVKNVAKAMRLTVKVDDTVSGTGEGFPMCWTVGVSKWSNYVVDSYAVAKTLSADELQKKEQAAKEKLIVEGGAHYVIDDLRDLPAVVEDINRRLENGENPWD